MIESGLSPHVNLIDDIRKLDRKQEVPRDGPMSDFLWSDPDKEVRTYCYQPRGAGYLFGEEYTVKFNRENNIHLIARAHQLIQERYQFLFNDKLVTVLSAPNYFPCGNDASIMEFDEHMNRSFKIFEACPENVWNQRDKKHTPEYFL